MLPGQGAAAPRLKYILLPVSNRVLLSDKLAELFEFHASQGPTLGLFGNNSTPLVTLTSATSATRIPPSPARNQALCHAPLIHSAF
jgi:hypothetical protein